MGLILCYPLEDPYGRLDAESQHHWAVFDCTAPLAKPVKTIRNWRKGPCEFLVFLFRSDGEALTPWLT
jgi:hypothetical protein